MKKIINLNFLLVVIIVSLILFILSFNYGYQLGERKGYVLGIQKCLEGMENRPPKTENL